MLQDYLYNHHDYNNDDEEDDGVDDDDEDDGVDDNDEDDGVDDDDDDPNIEGLRHQADGGVGRAMEPWDPWPGFDRYQFHPRLYLLSSR